MDVATASAILGVPRDANIDDAKQVYRARARLLHPDRAEDRLKKHAQQAMAQLNEAYAAFQGRTRYEPRRSPPPPPPPPRPSPRHGRPDPPPGEQRLPGVNECDLCGSSPAGPMTLRAITGLVVKWKAQPLTQKVCRACAAAIYNDTQARNLIRGWWSWAGLVVGLVALRENRVALGTHRKAVSTVAARDPHVIAPHEQPLQSASIWRRRAPWLATLAYIAVSVAVIAGVLTGMEWAKAAAAPNPAPPTFPLGECLDVNGAIAPCNSPDAAYEVTIGVLDPAHCGSASHPWRFAGDDTWYCARRL
jgi:hypothetical protein